MSKNASEEARVLRIQRAHCQTRIRICGIIETGKAIPAMARSIPIARFNDRVLLQARESCGRDQRSVLATYQATSAEIETRYFETYCLTFRLAAELLAAYCFVSCSRATRPITTRISRLVPFFPFRYLQFIVIQTLIAHKLASNREGNAELSSQIALDKRSPISRNSISILSVGLLRDERRG